MPLSTLLSLLTVVLAGDVVIDDGVCVEPGDSAVDGQCFLQLRANSTDALLNKGAVGKGLLFDTPFGAVKSAAESDRLAAGNAAVGKSAAGKSDNVAFVGIFSYDKDPQRGNVYKKDDPAHIKMWKDSVERIGISGVVLHDDVYSPEYAREASAVGPVKFQRIDPFADGLTTNPDLKKLTTADWRFIAFHDYLETHQHELGYVLLTDGHDVVFRKDPLRYMESVDEALGHAYVYGQDEWRPHRALFESKDPRNANRSSFMTALSRLVPYWHNCFEENMPEEYQIGRMPNCAILGGKVSVVLPFLKRMKYWYSKVPENKRFVMCDMLVYMRTVLEDYNDRFIAGYPWHAKFKDNEPFDVAVIYHKHGTADQAAAAPAAAERLEAERAGKN